MSRKAPCELPSHWAVAFLLHLRARQRAASDSPCGSSRRPEGRGCPGLSSPGGVGATWSPPVLDLPCPLSCSSGAASERLSLSAHGGAAPLQREAFFFKSSLFCNFYTRKASRVVVSSRRLHTWTELLQVLRRLAFS